MQASAHVRFSIGADRPLVYCPLANDPVQMQDIIVHKVYIKLSIKSIPREGIPHMKSNLNKFFQPPGAIYSKAVEFPHDR
jgi:hypothetical protein